VIGAALAGAMPGLGAYVLQVRRDFLRGSERPVSPLVYCGGLAGAVLFVAYLVAAALTL
jgi:hypothetical protein